MARQMNRIDGKYREHIAPRIAVLLAVVPLRVFLVEISGVLGIVPGPGVGGLIIQRFVGGFLLE